VCSAKKQGDDEEIGKPEYRVYPGRRRDTITGGYFSPPMTQSGTLFYRHIRQNIRRTFFCECKTGPDEREPVLSACQKSAGIERLPVEKPGADVLVLAV
jgi:hypothetical protein